MVCNKIYCTEDLNINICNSNLNINICRQQSLKLSFQNCLFICILSVYQNMKFNYNISEMMENITSHNLCVMPDFLTFTLKL